MSWKFSTPSYTSRDLCCSRENTSQSKLGAAPSKFGSERPSRWSSNTSLDPPRTFRINPPQAEMSPIIAKASFNNNPSSVVQRLKEKYITSNSIGGDGHGEKLSSMTHRPYGRSLTSLSIGSGGPKPKQTSYETDSKRDYSSGKTLQSSSNDGYRGRSRADKSPEPDRSFRISDSNQRAMKGYDGKTYSPTLQKSPVTCTSRFVPSKSISNETGKMSSAVNHDDIETEEVTVVARGTSPSQTSSSIYLRTRRADFGIEKKIQRAKIKPPFSHKETQTDKSEETHISRYAYGDLNARAKPWSNYVGGSSSYSSRYSNRSGFKSEKEPPSSPGYGIRSVSREGSSIELKAPECLQRSPVESPQSPKSLTDGLSHITAKPPTSFRSTETIKLNVQKPVSPNKDGEKVMPLRKTSSSNKQLKIETTSASEDHAKSPTPSLRKISQMKPVSPVEASKPTVNGIAVAGKITMNGPHPDSSSMSESSSEGETSSSDEEVERIRSSETSFVKKSITNFLQNKPNVPVRKQPSNAEMVGRSRSGVFHKLNGQLGPPPKITFNRVESGERAWWLENTDQVPEGVVRIVSNCSLAKPDLSSDGQGNERGRETPGNTTECNVSGNNQCNLSSFVSDSTTNNRFNTYLINRQFTTDVDWLRDTEDDASVHVEGEKDKWNLDGNNNISQRRESPHMRVCREECLSNAETANCDTSFVSTAATARIFNGAEFINNDNTRNARVLAISNIAQNACANIDMRSRNSVKEVNLSQLHPDPEDSFDVTPGLRRRREQNRGKSPEICNHQDTSYQPTFDASVEESDMKERNQARIQLNRMASPVEEMNVDVGDMSNLISKAKAGLGKSKAKADVRKSSSREMSPKHEIDLYWKELVDSLNRPLKLCDLDFTDLNSDDETDLFGKNREEGEIPPPPPMLILPPCNRVPDMKVPAPPATNRTPKTPAPPSPTIQNVKNKKTVKLFWKEVKDEPLPPAKPPGVTLIWDELAKVDVDTQKLEQLFESRAKDLITKKQHEQNKSKEIIVLDHKRSNAINIGMTKLPPPRAIKTAILKMDSTVVNKEGIEKLLTMLPTEEEKLRIQDAQSSNPDLPLGSAEQFLLILASISELEARLKLWAFKLDFENVEKEICEPLMDLKQGIEILRTNKTFRAILSTLLSIGNFLNGCDVKGFQIDYLSKVPEVKDTVQKHSLLHHLCVIVMEKFPESTDLYSEIGAVTRASKVDFDELAGSIKKIEEECKLSWSHLKVIAKHEGHTAMKVKMSDFLADCAERIIVLGIVHKRIMSRFHKFIFWLGTPTNRISITRPNETFKIISEFALEYRTTRERILQQLKKMNHREKNRSRSHLACEVLDGAEKMNSKEAKDDAKLRQLLSGDSIYSESMHNTSTWRRQRKDARALLDTTNGNDDEIIETLIKTANQLPSHRPSVKDRKRSTKVYDRKC